MYKKEPIVIGRNYKWEDIQGVLLRVKQFVSLASVESGKIIEYSDSSSYGSLVIENPYLFDEAYMFILNKGDFLNLWQVYKERGIKPEEEVIVLYEPIKKGFSSNTPGLLIQIYPKGSLMKLNSLKNVRNITSGKDWVNNIPKVIAEWDSRTGKSK
jgi:hypothetical protein